MPETALDPRGGNLPLGELVLRTPGLEGAAELSAGAQLTTTRAATPHDDLLAPALEGADLHLQHEVLLSRLAHAPMPERAGQIRGAGVARALELEVPEVTEGWGQMLLMTGSGVAAWQFSEPVAAAPGSLAAGAPARGGTRRRTYQIGLLSGPSEGGNPRVRGLLGIAGQVVVRVLAFPLVEPVVGRLGDYFAGRWEKEWRPYRVRRFTPDDYARADALELDPPGWERLGEGRALLFLHGAFGRAHTAFGRLPRETVAELDGRYGGRVFAFDHYTLSADPLENARRLVAALPEGARLDLDVVSHARGGLLARVLAECQEEISLGSRELRIERVVFAGTPNAGTVLADIDHLGDLVDAFTTLLSFVPDNGVTDVLGTVITLAKVLAVGALKGLDGLTAMSPKSPFLERLNGGSAPSTRYLALASNYEPTTSALTDWARNRLTDRLFARAENDLIVPTHSVYAANGCPAFPIADPHLFGPADGIAHNAYFATAPATTKLLEWLPG